MEPSPVQLLHLTFRKVLVEIDETVPFDVESLSFLSAFDFDGVNLSTSVEIEELSDIDEVDRNGHVYRIDLSLEVSNENVEDEEIFVPSPYCLNLQVSALVRVSGGGDDPDFARDLAAVNGAALAWSALREQVSNITARMARGPALLPSVHFLDLRHSLRDASAPRSARAPRSQKKRRVAK